MHPSARRIAASYLLAAGLFALHHAGVVSGAVAPPAGFEPAWVVRNLDVPQYLTWINASREHWLIPDFHAPWRTGRDLFQPLFWIAAQIPLPAVAAYYALHFALYWIGAWILLYACSVFVPGRETWFALAAIFCAVPFRLYGWLIASLVGSMRWKAIFVNGLLDYGYDTADGLTRGGLSNSPTLTLGTISVLLAMTLLASFLERPSRRVLAGLCATACLSAFLHPFEIFLIIAASAAPLIIFRRVQAWIAVCASGAAGASPFLYESARSAWVRDTGELIRSSFHPFWVLADFGPVCVLCVYLLLIRFRMPKPRDIVLQSWFLTVPLLLLVPGIPFAMHMLAGFAYCAAFLLVRRISIDPQIRPLLARHPRPAFAALASIAAISMLAIGCFEIQIWRDGRSADPAWLINSIRRPAERELLDWIARETPHDALVVSPGELAPWIATVPRPSFASHDFFSITFDAQRELANRFLKGEIPASSLIDAYGASVLVVPAISPAIANMPAAALRTTIGPWRIYQFKASMKPYPGFGALEPGQARSLRWRVLNWIASRFSSQ